MKYQLLATSSALICALLMSSISQGGLQSAKDECSEVTQSIFNLENETSKADNALKPILQFQIETLKVYLDHLNSMRSCDEVNSDTKHRISEVIQSLNEFHKGSQFDSKEVIALVNFIELNHEHWQKEKQFGPYLFQLKRVDNGKEGGREKYED